MSLYPVTRRHFLIYDAVLKGATVRDATEAVADMAFDNPEWDMYELRTWSEWRSGDAPSAPNTEQGDSSWEHAAQ